MSYKVQLHSLVLRSCTSMRPAVLTASQEESPLIWQVGSYSVSALLIQRKYLGHRMEKQLPFSKPLYSTNDLMFYTVFTKNNHF